MAKKVITFKATGALQKKLEALKDNKELRYKINQKIAELCDPYVPYESGDLASNTVITDKGITYKQPYARYQYWGKLMLSPTGSAFAHTDEKKHPTGIPLSYSHAVHPLATSEWDKAMLRDKSATLNRAVGQYIRKAMK